MACMVSWERSMTMEAAMMLKRDLLMTAFLSILPTELLSKVFLST